jgi:AraC-like DNA-binding protein
MRVFREITPVTNSDVFVILDSVNKGFDYPIHNHPEYELNLVLNSVGTRIVGDSTEKYKHADLVLIGPYLFHKWDSEDKDPDDSKDCRVITIQFDMHLFDQHFLSRKPFYRVKGLLENAARGIRFTGHTLELVRDIMTQLTHLRGIEGVIAFMRLLDILSQSEEYQYLASEGFDGKAIHTRSKRLHTAYQYIIRHFRDADLKMCDVASKVNMTDSAFSHFFKKITNKSFSKFLIEMRLGHTCKLLLETDELIINISCASGFNNVANFNRLFKKIHRCTPHEFRKLYQEKAQFDWTEQRTPGQFVPRDVEIGSEYRPTEYATELVHG